MREKINKKSAKILQTQVEPKNERLSKNGTKKKTIFFHCSIETNFVSEAELQFVTTSEKTSNSSSKETKNHIMKEKAK